MDREAKPLPAPFGGADWSWSGEVLVAFRSSERSWSWRFALWPYKHLTPDGVKTAVEVRTFSSLKIEFS